MTRRKADIEYIQSLLTNFSKVFQFSAEDNPPDYCNDLESAFCEFLNQVYGWNLKNDGHKVKDSMVFYLVDDERGVCVQVNSEVSRKGIESSITDFHVNYGSESIDKRILIILSDKRKAKRIPKFVSSSGLGQDIEVITFKNLCKHIKVLDPHEAADICSYFDDEFCEKNFPHYKSRKYGFHVFWMVPLLLIILLCLYAANYITSQNAPAAYVLSSQILKYKEAGVYESYDDASPVHKTEIETDSAFSILSFIRPNDSANTIVESQSCHILSLDPIEYPDIHIDGAIVDDKLRIFAFNDGWETAYGLSIETASLGEQNSNDSLAKITSRTEVMDKVDVPPASAAFLAEYTLDRAKFQEYFEPNADKPFYNPQVSFTVQGQNCSAQWYAFLFFKNDEFLLDFPGIGGPGSEYNITLFAVLDVDNPPKHIIFSGETSNPRINHDILRIETVIAPTKSCIVKCRNEFTVDGKIQQTPDYTVTVTVPAFAADDLGREGPMAVELASLDSFDEFSIQKCIKKYRYDPESVCKDHTG